MQLSTTRPPRLLATLALLTAPLLAGGGTQVSQLLPAGVVGGDYVGRAVAVNGSGIAVLGAFGDNALRGAAYIVDASSGAELHMLQASDGTSGDGFGTSVAISRETIVVGSLWQDGGAALSGRAYVFDATTGTQSRILIASDSTSFDYFGFSVAVSDTTAVVGTPGDNIVFSPGGATTEIGWAYLFDTATGNQLARLDPTDGQVADFFGHSVAISGTTAIVGAPEHDANGSGSGAVYVFDATTGAQTAKWTALDGGGGDRFGFAVGISGTTAIIGARGADAPGASSVGAVYLFDTVTGTQLAKLTAADATSGQFDGFGAAVAISGTQAVVGAPLDDDSGSNAGAGYLFDAVTGLQIAKLLATGGQPGDNLGTAIAVGGERVVVGAPYNADQGTNAGSAYSFEAHPPAEGYCTAGLSASGCQALLSSSGVASATASSGFALSAAGVEGQKDGLFFFGANGRQANAWGSGTSLQCVAPPVRRAGLLTGNGTPGQCDGAFSQDLNALWCPTCPKSAGNPGAGAVVQAQLWYRDPLNTSNQTTSLSDALEFVVVP